MNTRSAQFTVWENEMLEIAPLFSAIKIFLLFGMLQEYRLSSQKPVKCL